MVRVDGLDCVIHHHGAGIVKPRELREEIEESLNENLGGPALDYLLRMLARTSIWLPVELHVSMPVLLPHVLRDNNCRTQYCQTGHKKRRKGRLGEPRDLWSTPSPEGYVRDDNSLIKQVAKTLKIESPDPMLDGKKMGRNWVACHIWPMSTASDPWLNSFVPNLVWLPKPFDVMSDRDGHLVQDILRHVSLLRYAAEKTVTPGVATQLFRRLNPNSDTALGFEVRNTFKPDASWRRRYWKKVEDMAGILEARAAGDDAPCGSGHSHYDGHVNELEPENVLPLAERLRAYIAGRNKRAKTTHG